MPEIFLSRPDEKYKDSFIAAMREFEKEGLPPTWKFEMLEEHFDEYVQMVLEQESDPLEGYVPAKVLWLIVDGEYAGRVDIRHYLNEKLEKFGGHIGYNIRPSMRGKGYGTLQLKLGLPHAWALGIERALITCDDDNIGSQKIIEANGGVLQDKVDNGRHVLSRRYWVEKPSDG
jgi:predicted acetyltransferase